MIEPLFNLMYGVLVAFVIPVLAVCVVAYVNRLIARMQNKYYKVTALLELERLKNTRPEFKPQPHPYYGHLSNDLANYMEEEIVWLEDMVDGNRVGGIKHLLRERLKQISDTLYCDDNKSIQR